jgi:DNA polymerase-1
MPVLIVDGNNLAHRMYHHPILQQFVRPDGKKTGMFLGCMTALHKLLVKFQPSQVIVVFDGVGGSASRKAQYEGYKAQRHTALTGTFRRQLKAMKLCVASLGISVLEREGVEADDLIFHLARLAVKEFGKKAIIVSSDRDMLQCVTDQVMVYDERQRFMWTATTVKTVYHLTPDEIPLLKALEGDASDGVKGVPGIGRVKGTEIIHRYRTAEKISDHLTEDQQEAFAKSLMVVQLADEPGLRELAHLHIASAKPFQADMARMTLTQYHCLAILKRFDAWASPFKQLASARIRKGTA